MFGEVGGENKKGGGGDMIGRGKYVFFICMVKETEMTAPLCDIISSI